MLKTLKFYPTIAMIFANIISAETFTLESYVKKAISLSHEIKEEKENLEIAKRGYVSSLASLYFPEIYYSFQNTLYSDTKTNFSINCKNSVSEIILNYNLFNNFKDKLSAEIAYLKNSQVEINLWLKKQEITLDAIKRYCDLLKSQKLLEVMKANEDSYATEYEKSLTYYKEGLRSYSDLLKSELNLKNARLSTLSAQNLSKKNLMEFNYRIYERPLTENVASEIVFSDGMETLSIEKAVEEALKNRKEIQAYKNNLKIKEKELKQKNIGLYPDVKFDFSYTRSNAFGLSELYAQKNDYGLIFSLSIPFGPQLYDKFKDYYDNKIYKERIEREMEELKLSIEKEVISAYLNLDYAKKRYEVSKTNVDISRVNLEIVKSKYSEGKASILELIEAQKDDLQAQSDLAESFYDFYVSIALYKKAIGQKLWSE